MTAFSITFDTDDVLAAAARMERIDGVMLNALLTEVVHEAAAGFDTRTRRAMNAGIALDDGYISSRMDRENTAGLPRSTITAAGPDRPNRFGLTILGHYSPQITTTDAPGAKGDPKRGISAGRKATGVAVEVTRGARKSIPGAFTMTLKQGTAAGDKVGVFTRAPGGKARHRYGVSPYSMFRAQVDEGTGVRLPDELLQAALVVIDKAVTL